MTPTNERFVAVAKIQKWRTQGYTVHEIALMWNQGDTAPCSRGVNSANVEYDSCAYAKGVVAYYKAQ